MTVKIACFFRCAASQLWQGCRAADKYTMTTKPLCWVPYYSVELSHKNTRPCCKFDSNIQGPYSKFEDFFSADSDKWREDSFMGDKLLDQCKACKVPQNVYSHEKNNRKRYTLDGWTAPTKTELRKLIIGMDNICASSCIQCGPHFSTTIDKLARDSGQHKPILGEDYQFPGVQQVDLTQLDGRLADLEILQLWGGEPLFSPNLLTLLDMVRAQSPKLRTVGICTGLRKIKESHVAALASLNVEVIVNVSIDGPLDINHWIRGITPSEFTSAFDLLVKYKPNIKIVGFQNTIGSYNVFSLPEYVDTINTIWLENNLNKQEITNSSPYYKTNPYLTSGIILHPEVLHPKQMPDTIKQQIDLKLKKALITAPNWAKEMLRTGIFSLSQPSNLPWTSALERVNAYPKWRDGSSNWQDWHDRYMPK